VASVFLPKNIPLSGTDFKTSASAKLYRWHRHSLPMPSKKPPIQPSLKRPIAFGKTRRQKNAPRQKNQAWGVRYYRETVREFL
jgi:hypothetical protein